MGGINSARIQLVAVCGGDIGSMLSLIVCVVSLPSRHLYVHVIPSFVAFCASSQEVDVGATLKRIVLFIEDWAIENRSSTVVGLGAHVKPPTASRRRCVGLNCRTHRNILHFVCCAT